MKPYTWMIRLALVVVAFALVTWLVYDNRAHAQSSTELTPQEKRGKQIYLKGEGDTSEEIKAILGTGDLELPASSFPCANCHGLRGEGSKEGGLPPPRLNWASLTSRHQSALTRQERVPYSEATLARAITAGIDSSGGRLHPGMPHYKMAAAQLSDLIAYLKKIGNESDVDPGLGEGSIRVGAALPITGALARIGEDVKAALEATFADVNSRGGIYGRKMELVVEDSRGDSAGTYEATKRLVEQGKVFALVGSFEPGNSDMTNEYLKRQEVPLIGPVTLSPRLPAVPNRYVFYLLPSFGDQARSLVDFIGSEESRPKARPASRLAVVYADNSFNQDALSGLRLQAKMYSMKIVAEQSYDPGRLSAVAAVGSLAANKPDYIFFFGGSDEITALATEMERAGLEAGLLSSAIMIGQGAFNLPPSVAARTYLSYPASLPNRDDFREFLAVMQRARVNLRGTAFQATAYGAAKVFIEATKNSGRQFSRVGLINALEQLHDFKIGAMPPVTFGPNRRVGATGSYIVTPGLNKKEYVVVGDRVVPKGSTY